MREELPAFLLLSLPHSHPRSSSTSASYFASPFQEKSGSGQILRYPLRGRCLNIQRGAKERKKEETEEHSSKIIGVYHRVILNKEGDFGTAKSVSGGQVGCWKFTNNPKQ